MVGMRGGDGGWGAIAFSGTLRRGRQGGLWAIGDAAGGRGDDSGAMSEVSRVSSAGKTMAIAMVSIAMGAGCGARTELRAACVVEPAVTEPRVVLLMSLDENIAAALRWSQRGYPWRMLVTGEHLPELDTLVQIPAVIAAESRRASIAVQTVQPVPWGAMRTRGTPVSADWCTIAPGLLFDFGQLTEERWIQVWDAQVATNQYALVPIRAALEALERYVPAGRGRSAPRIVLLSAQTMGSCEPTANANHCLLPWQTTNAVCVRDRTEPSGTLVAVNHPLCCGEPDPVEQQVAAMRSRGVFVASMMTFVPGDGGEEGHFRFRRDWEHYNRVAELGGLPRDSTDERRVYRSVNPELSEAFSRSIDRVSRCVRALPAGFRRTNAWQLHVDGWSASDSGESGWRYAPWAEDNIELTGDACAAAIRSPESVRLMATEGC